MTKLVRVSEKKKRNILLIPCRGCDWLEWAVVYYQLQKYFVILIQYIFVKKTVPYQKLQLL